jgi:hypothetical protein
MLITPSQLKIIHTLFNKIGNAPHKKDIIAGFTNGRSESSKDLYFDEATDLIKYLKNFDNEAISAERMRRNIISMAHELNWKLPDTGKIDMKRVNGWCEKFGYQHKPLNNYTYEELPKLVTQFKNGPYSHFIKNL